MGWRHSAPAFGLLLAITVLFSIHPAHATQLAVTPTATAANGPCTHSAYPVPNGGFRSGQLAPWTPDPEATGVNFSVISTNATADGYAVRLQAIPGRGKSPPNGALTLDNITVCGATAYNLSFLYRSLRTVPDCNAYVRPVGYGVHGSDIQWTYANLTKTDGFQNSSVPLRVTSDDGYNIYLILACSNYPHGFAAIDFDKFELRAVRSLDAPGCPNPAATLTNGDFETGNLAPWQLYPYNNQTTAGLVHTPHSLRNSSYNVRVSFLPPPNSTATGDEGFNLVQPIPDLCLDYHYDVSLDYRWRSPHLAQIPKSATLHVVIRGCGEARIPPGTGAWQTYHFTCLAGRNTNTTFEASFVIGYGDGQPAFPAFTLDLDNISFRLSSP